MNDAADSAKSMARVAELIQRGRLEEALDALARLIRSTPNRADAHLARGNILQSQGLLDGALAAYDRALRIEPDLASAHNNRGNVLLKKGRLADAKSAYDRAIDGAPKLAEAYSNRAAVLFRQGRLDQAVADADRALALKPTDIEALNTRGLVLKSLNRLDEALDAFDRALALHPDLATLHSNRGNVLRNLGRLGEARSAYDHALRLQPEYAEAHNNRGMVLQDQGEFELALADFRRAMAVRPDYVEAHSNYLFCLNYDPAIGDDALAEAHRAWGLRHGSRGQVITTYENTRDGDRMIRVGLVSADLRRHPTGYFLDGLLPAIDGSRMQVIVYSGHAKEDDLSRRLKRHVHGWRLVAGLSDQALADAVRGDGIDILIDLSGHTGGNRLTCFALKPAPVQVTWLGSCHSTGLPAIDYILMDPVYVAPGDERWFTETVVRLPDIRWCYAPPDYAPDVTDPPMLQGAAVTFGSFNNLSKVNADVISLWSRVLNAVPGARLMLSWRSLSDAGQRDRIKTAFRACGIEAARLILSPGEATHERVLAAYGRVDIALDPFPFSGCLTTFEALWMGVPVITLPGRRPASRQSLGILSVLGRTDWVARNADDYVHIAAELARDPEGLAAVRRSLRPRMAGSPLCDGAALARQLEQALRQMWRAWCVSSRGG